MDYAIRLTDTPNDATRRAILDPLAAYNRVNSGRSDPRPLILAIEGPTGQVIGGLWGRTAYDWLLIELLFVPEDMRGRGIGRNLVAKAEQEAVSRGCHSAWLDTFEFQARGFYERLGYTCFGELENYPAGSGRFFLRKRFTTSDPAPLPS